MTIKRKDIITVSGSYYQPVDLFMLELRERKELDSYDGFRAYDIDGFLWNKHTMNAITVEAKAFVDWPRADQTLTLQMLDEELKKATRFNYRGTYILQMEGNSPFAGSSSLSYYANNQWHKLEPALSGDELYMAIAWLLTQKKNV